LVLSIQNIDSISTFQVPFFNPDTIQQAVFSFDKVAGDIQSDTSLAVLSIIEQPASGHFLQQNEVLLNIITRPQNFFNFITVFFIGLLLILALIWYFFPERLLRLLSREGSRHKLKYSDNQFAKPGVFLYSLLLLTFISTSSAFVFAYVKSCFPQKFAAYPINEMLIGIPITIATYFMIRFLIINLTGFLFRTRELASKQIKSNFRIDLVQSFILIPLLIILLNTSYYLLWYVGLFLIASVIIYKWGVTIIIGLKSSKISLYHNILYLCALEIIPVIILMKLIANYQILFSN